MQLGFPNWPLKPTGPTVESATKNTGSAHTFSSYGSGYGTPATLGYQTGFAGYQTVTAGYKTGTAGYQPGTDGYQTGAESYAYARENKEAKSVDSGSSAYKTDATKTSGKGKENLCNYFSWRYCVLTECLSHFKKPRKVRSPREGDTAVTAAGMW